MYLVDTSVFMRLANGAHGAERIERRIIEVTIEKCFINPVIAYEIRGKIETDAGRVKKHALEFMADMLSTIQCIGIDCTAGQESGLILKTAVTERKLAETVVPQGLAEVRPNCSTIGRILLKPLWRKSFPVFRNSNCGF